MPSSDIPSRFDRGRNLEGAPDHGKHGAQPGQPCLERVSPRPAGSVARRSTCALLMLAVASCAAARLPPGQAFVDPDSGEVVPTDQLAIPPFMVVQRLSGQHGTQNVSFESVVQLSRGALTVTGMTPFTRRAFTVEQRGIDVHFQTFMMRDVPLAPIDVLHDVHRLFFRGMPAPQSDGVHQSVDHGEVVREVWRGGQLVERRFHALETFAKLVTIRFYGAPAPVIAPRVRLRNLHYGYTLEIENLEQKRLESGYTLDVDSLSAR